MINMKRTVYQLIVVIVVACFSLLLAPQTSYAACPASGSSSGKVLEGVGNTGPCNEDALDKTISQVVKILSYIAGALAIIMVIVAGFKYITSGGDSGRVGSAKNTLIYALVGLAIAVLAQALVHFVLAKANKVSSVDTNSKASLLVARDD